MSPMRARAGTASAHATAWTFGRMPRSRWRESTDSLVQTSRAITHCHSMGYRTFATPLLADLLEAAEYPATAGSRRPILPLQQSFPALPVPLVYAHWPPTSPQNEFLRRTGEFLGEFSRICGFLGGAIDTAPSGNKTELRQATVVESGRS